MTQTPKQWATTGFIIGVASGIAAALIIFFLMRNETTAVAQPLPSAPSAATVGPTDPSPSNTPLISGTIDLQASDRVPLPAIVFVIARGEGLQQHGHPLLAQRLDVRSFPVNFSLGAEDSMMGQPPPKRVSIEARVDRDGDATTREPGAPTASLDSVAMGTTNLNLVLRAKP